VSPLIAFKEGWAEFIGRVVFAPTRGCARPSYDKNGPTATCDPLRKQVADLEQKVADQQQLVANLPGAGHDAAQGVLDDLEAQLATRRIALAKCQDNTTTDLPGSLGEGAWWRDNVTKALCDWYDAAPDDDERMAGAGDRFADDNIQAMWLNLERMKLDASKYGGQVTNPGLWFCDYVSYYLDVRMSEAAVGTRAHAGFEDAIRDLIFNNNIACSMTPPS